MSRRAYAWTLVSLGTLVPFAIVLCTTLLRTPFPLSEGVALLEDVARQPPARFLIPDTPYYRPLFHVTLSAIWHGAGSAESAAIWIKLSQIAPVVILIIVFILYLTPRTPLDAGSAVTAAAVLVGSAAFRDNVEIPLSYTTVGMPAALLAWILANRPSGRWTGAALAALTVIAVGFKEQGLVLVPVLLAAWWMGAPGIGRRTATLLAAGAAAYVAMRLIYLPERGAGPIFEQAIGFGFTVIEPSEAAGRFGAFPLWIYAYNGMSTMANVLFSEPTAGVFRIVQDLGDGTVAPWEMVQLLSSMSVTGLIAWWGIDAWRSSAKGAWSPDARLFAATLVALFASGALSFNYSRDRLGGMALVFYALATYFAVRAAAGRARHAARPSMAAAGLGLLLLACAWQTRVLGTLEHVRTAASLNQVRWLTGLPQRRDEFRDRPVYLRIMESLREQGIAPDPPRATSYPRAIAEMLGP